MMKNETKTMTYRELLAKLDNLPSERLDDTVTVQMPNDDFYGVESAITATDEGCDVLDEGHLFLRVV
jgi:hypothetical protein